MYDYSADHDFGQFQEELKHHNRFFVNQKFLESLKEVVKLNSQILERGTKFYRARIHNNETPMDVPLNGKELLNPEPNKAIRGRANPDGISYLYLSSDIDLCIKEVTPKFKDIVTVGEFVLKSKIEIIDLLSLFPSSQSNYINSLNHHIRMTFSKAQLSTRPEIEYLPHQYICELIKNENYAGVKYKSAFANTILDRAFNLVLFNPSLAELNDSASNLLEITSTEYRYASLN